MFVSLGAEEDDRSRMRYRSGEPTCNERVHSSLGGASREGRSWGQSYTC